MRPSAWGSALSLQSAVVHAASVGIRVMIGYRAIANGADPIFLGVLAASFSLPALLASLSVGRLSDRVGGSILTLGGGILMVGGMLAMALLPGLPILVVTSAVVGLGHLFSMVGQQTLVAHRAAGGASEGGFGNLSAAASIGQLVGPPLVTTVATLGALHAGRPDTTVGIFVCLALAALGLPTYFVLRSTDVGRRTLVRSAERPNSSARAVLATPGLWRALVVSGAVLATSDLIYAFLPVLATETGISAVAVGWLLALRAGVSVCSRFGLANLISRFGRRVLLLVSILAGAAGLIALPVAGLPGAIIAMVALGITLGLPQPLTMAWVVNVSNPALHGAALGLRISANRLAQVTLPLAVSTLAAPLGVAGIFWANAVLLAVAATIVPRDPPREPPGTDENPESRLDAD